MRMIALQVDLFHVLRYLIAVCNPLQFHHLIRTSTLLQDEFDKPFVLFKVVHRSHLHL